MPVVNIMDLSKKVDEFDSKLIKDLIHSFTARYTIKRTFINSKDEFKLRAIIFIIKAMYKDILENTIHNVSNIEVSKKTLHCDCKYSNVNLFVDLDTEDVYETIYDSNPTFYIIKSDEVMNVFDKLFLLKANYDGIPKDQINKILNCTFFNFIRAVWNNELDDPDVVNFKKGFISDSTFNIKYFTLNEHLFTKELLSYINYGKLVNSEFYKENYGVTNV